MTNKLIAVLTLVGAMFFAGSAIAGGKAGTPGAGKGSSNAAEHPTCQGHGLGFINSGLHPFLVSIGEKGLGTFWQNPAFFPGDGPGATPAISLFFALDTVASPPGFGCEEAFADFGIPDRTH